MQSIRIFISSPGDVAEERAIAREVIKNLQVDPLLRGVHLQTVAWDDPDARTPMLATLTPQEAISRGLGKPSECDIVVVMMWARFGSPLDVDQHGLKPDGTPFLSGTEWEFLDALGPALKTGKPQVVVYRREESISLNPADPDFNERSLQYERVKTFFQGFKDGEGVYKRGYNSYNSPNDFRKLFEIDIRVLIRPLIELQPELEAAVLPSWEGSPFPGLRAFTAEDSTIFFGRGSQSDDLVRRVAESRFTAVVGASGVGKSSLVGAGLLPRLAANAISSATTGSKDWIICRFTPAQENHNPFASLAAQLHPYAKEQYATSAQLATFLSGHPDNIDELCTLALNGKPEWAELLLFIDQFEELFTLVNTAMQKPFVDLLGMALTAQRWRVVVTLRADFYQRAVEDEKLAKLLKSGSFPLAAPGFSVLKEIVTEPAALAGLDFDSGLVDRILTETGGRAGILPLLAYLLEQLYQRKEGHRLTTNAYIHLGGVQGAISETAERAFNELPPAAQNAFPSVFRHLVEIAEDSIVARRHVPLMDVNQLPGSETLINGLIGQRLLVSGETDAHQPTIEIAHEALLQSWPRLRASLKEDRDFLLWRGRLRDDVQRWIDSKHNSSYLYRAVRLAEALIWIKKYEGDLSADEQHFIEESRRLRQRWRLAAGALLAVPILISVLTLSYLGYMALLKRSASGPTVSFSPSTAKVGTNTQSVNGFSIDQYPVTYRQYRLCFQAGVCSRPKEPVGETGFKTAGGDFPIVWVDANQALTFCQWIGRRLPSAVEWERTARGTDGRLLPWTNIAPASPQELRSHIQLTVDGVSDIPSGTAKVSDFTNGATPEGVMHMLGNVAQWTASPSKQGNACYPNCPLWDGSEAIALDVRGRGWNGPNVSLSNLDGLLSTGNPTDATYSDAGIGFRCVSAD